MGLKIKWNDDRVRATTTALLLIVRDRLARGETRDLFAAALADYRGDPDGYKRDKSAWPDVGEAGPLTNALDVAYYQRLVSSVDVLVARMVKGKRQFNSLSELDNFLVFSLKSVR